MPNFHVLGCCIYKQRVYPCAKGDNFQESRMWEICLSGSMREEWARRLPCLFLYSNVSSLFSLCRSGSSGLGQ